MTALFFTQTCRFNPVNCMPKNTILSTDQELLREARNALSTAGPPQAFLTADQAAALCVCTARLTARLIREQAYNDVPTTGQAWGNVKQIADHLGLTRSPLFAILDDLASAGRVRTIGGELVGRNMQKRYNIPDVIAALTPKDTH